MNFKLSFISFQLIYLYISQFSRRSKLKDSSFQWLAIVDKDLEEKRGQKVKSRNYMLAAITALFTIIGTLVTLIKNNNLTFNDFDQVNLFFSSMAWTVVAFGLISSLFWKSRHSSMVFNMKVKQLYKQPTNPDDVAYAIFMGLICLSYLLSLQFLWNSDPEDFLHYPYMFGFIIFFIVYLFAFLMSIEKKIASSSIEKTSNDPKFEKITNVAKPLMSLIFLIFGIFSIYYSWKLFPIEQYILAAGLIYLITILTYYTFGSFARWIKSDIKINDLTDLRVWIITFDPNEKDIVESYKVVFELVKPTEIEKLTLKSEGQT